MNSWPSRASEFPNDNPKLHEGAVWICVSVCGPPRAVVRPRLQDVDVAPKPAEPEGEAVASTQAGVEASAASTQAGVEAAPCAGVEVVAEGSMEAELVGRPNSPAEALPSAPAANAEPAGPVASPSEFPDAVELEPVPVEVEVDGDELEADPFADQVAHALGCLGEVVGAAPACVEPEAEPEPDDFAQYVDALVAVASSHGATRAAAAIRGLLEQGRLASDLCDAARDALAQAGVVSTGGGLTPVFSATANAWRQVLSGTSDDLSACGSDTLDGWSAALLAALLATPSEAESLRRELRRHGVAAFGMIAQAA